MEHNLQQTIALLTNAPATFSSLLHNLPEAMTQANEGEGTWTPGDILAHINHCERTDWLPRAKIILTQGESQTFSPLDRTAHQHTAQRQTLPQLLEEFTHLRTHNLAELQALNLTPHDLQRRGQHPAFGPVTLSQLLATWATHDLTHLHQLTRILAHQYREAVGPWSAYLGVLHCDGHSKP